jgi:hypothetical protein
MLISSKKFICCLPACALILIASDFPLVCLGENNFNAGFIYDRFSLTLDSGERTEAAGPFFYKQEKDSEKIWAIPPLFSREQDPAIEQGEDDFLYPLLTREHYGQEYRWQLIQLFSFSGGQEPESSGERRFTIYPLYFQQRSTDTNRNYTALIPFYGHLQNRLFRDKIFFILFPIYGQTQKRDIVNNNYLYPFFNVRHGDGMHGWQFWPFFGSEHKDVTTTTNGFGDVETIAGHDGFFALWPFYFHQDNGIGTDNPEKFRASIPFYVESRSPKRDSTSVLWPFFTRIDDREKKYREWQEPWPFVIFTRGEGKTTSRIWPLFSQSRNDEQENISYLWPIYQFHHRHFDPLDIQRTRIAFYLYEDTVEKNTETGAEKQRVDMWPFFTWHRDNDGRTRLQVLAPIEPAVPDNRGIERDWSPLWSLWRAEDSPKTGRSSRSLLWNLYRSDETTDAKKISLLFGLFQYQSSGETSKLRLFYIPVQDAHGQAK